MNVNKMMSDKLVASPQGTAYWSKVNTVVDDNNGKLNFQISVEFDADTEAKMKKYCNGLIEKAKAMPEFDGKKWRNEPYMPYHTSDDGQTLFKFKTAAFVKDRTTGEDVKKVIPVVDVKKNKRLDVKTAIGNGSKVRIAFKPGVYWSTASSNGLNLYLESIAVDDLVKYGSGDDFSVFGITLDEESEESDGIVNAIDDDEEVPI